MNKIIISSSLYFLTFESVLDHSWCQSACFKYAVQHVRMGVRDHTHTWFTSDECPQATPASASLSRRCVYSEIWPLSALSGRWHTVRSAWEGRWESAKPQWKWQTASRLPARRHCRGCTTRKGGCNRPKSDIWPRWQSRVSGSRCIPARSPRPGAGFWSGSWEERPRPPICRCWELPCSASHSWWEKCRGIPQAGISRCPRGGRRWPARPESGACWTRIATGCKMSSWEWKARVPGCGSRGYTGSRSEQ